MEDSLPRDRVGVWFQDESSAKFIAYFISIVITLDVHKDPTTWIP